MFDEIWQIDIGNYCGQILHHLPSHTLFNFISRHPVTFPVMCKPFPIPDAQMAFTDGSANGKASIVITNQHNVLQTQETSAQRAELTVVIEAFVVFSEEEFNLYSDSQYVVRLFTHIETAVLPKTNTAIFHLSTRLQQQIWERNRPFFVGHIRAHSCLPGPLSVLNYLADSLTRISVASVFKEALSFSLTSSSECHCVRIPVSNSSRICPRDCSFLFTLSNYHECFASGS